MWPRGDSRAESRQAAVIDVGSNSVRLVIYRLDGRSIWTLYNEKALAGLGRDLPATGRLSPEGVEVAMTAMFLGASIPMLDERSVARRPGYAEHMQRVPALLPRRPHR